MKDRNLKIEDAVNEVMKLIGSNIECWSLHNYHHIKKKSQEQLQNIKNENKNVSEQQIENDGAYKKHYRKRG